MITKKTTEELLNILTSIDSPSELCAYSKEIVKSEKDITFQEYLARKIQEKQVITSRLLESSQIQRNYGYQILNGTKTPGRDKVVALCLSLGLSVEETQRALTLANAAALYARKRRDSILIFALNKKLSVLDANELLYELSEEPLH